jgi:hypothetical protein
MFNLHAEKHKAASSSFVPDFVRPLIVKNCLRFSTFQHEISDLLQIYSGWLDEHDHGMQIWPPIFLTDIMQFLLAHGDVALANNMLIAERL